jgi:hypothetical protein
MAIFKNSMAHKIREYMKLNPKATAETVAKDLGIPVNVVHSTKWRDKKLGAPKRKYTKRPETFVLNPQQVAAMRKIPEGKWTPIAMVSSNTPFEPKVMEMPITMEEPNVDGDLIKFGDEVGGLILVDAGNGKGRWVRKEEPKADMVNQPPHYKVGGIEVIDFIQAKLTPEEFRGYLKGNVLKYTSRAGHKDDARQDIGKLVWYATKLQETHTT